MPGSAGIRSEPCHPFLLASPDAGLSRASSGPEAVREAVSSAAGGPVRAVHELEAKVGVRPQASRPPLSLGEAAGERRGLAAVVVPARSCE